MGEINGADHSMLSERHVSESGVPSNMGQDVMQDCARQIRINLARHAFSDENFNPPTSKMSRRVQLKNRRYLLTSL